MNLTEFLLARIAEDEAAAKGGLGKANYYQENAAEETLSMAYNEGCASAGPEHFARWRPARVLAECEAKRGIIEAAWADHLRIEGEWGDCRGQDELSALNDYPYALRYLALPYADHPDFDEAWRP